MKFLPNCKFSIKIEDIITNEFFNECYLAVCFISAIIFERAHAKRQSIIMYQKDDNFPLKQNTDYLHFINSRNELKMIIQKNILN